MNEMKVNERALLVVDPGSQKSGIAVLNFCGEILEKKVCVNEEVLEAIGFLDHQYVPVIWVIGDKGAGREISRMIEEQNIRSVEISF